MREVKNLFCAPLFCATLAACSTGAEKSDSANPRDCFGQEPYVGRDCRGAQILGYGDCFVYSAAPDFAEEASLQFSVPRFPLEKIKVKTASQIKSNYIGVNTSRMPRTRENDEYFSSPANLIDGNDSTCWTSLGRSTPETYPAWIRLDFPAEKEISKIVLKERRPLAKRYKHSKLPMKDAAEVGCAIPSEIKIETSSDGRNWTAVFSGSVQINSGGTAEFSIPENSIRALRVTGLKLKWVENDGCAFSIAEIEAMDKNGKNVSQISNGVSVVTSGTHNFMRLSNEMYSQLWKIHGQLGGKYVRIGYHDDPINWHSVERTRGVLKVDEDADRAINTLARDGMKIVMCLNFGNKLYEKREVANIAGKMGENPSEQTAGKKFSSGAGYGGLSQLPEWYYDQPPPPSSEEALRAWERYVEFMARKYAGKVEYFEIWNEWNLSLYWGGSPNPDLYLDIAKRAVGAIRRVAPNAKIMMGSVSGFPYGCAKWTAEQWSNPPTPNARNMIRVFESLAPIVDAVGVHPYYQPKDFEIASFDADWPVFENWIRSKGLKGKIMVSEWNYSTMFPEISDEFKKSAWRQGSNFSEIQKAKSVLQRFVSDASRGAPSMFCEMFNPYYGALSLSLLKRPEPDAQLQPEASFYAVRNLAGISDGFEPDNFKVSVKAREADFEKDIVVRTFKTQKGGAIAVWRGYKTSDVCARTPVDISFPFGVKNAVAIDILNGVSQKLVSGGWQIESLMVNDSPLVVEFEY